MTFSQRELRALGTEPAPHTFSLVNESLTKAAESGRYIFLSHSNLDSNLATGCVKMVRRLGVNVYFDLYDSTLTLPPSEDTANKLRLRIQKAFHFILLATENSVRQSRWCPWELGCADGNVVPISIARTKDDTGKEWGAEYLRLYHSLEIKTDRSYSQRIARMMPIVESNGSPRFEKWFS